MNMKSVVLYERGKSELREVPVPEIGDSDILLKVTACGICGSDLHTFYGVLPPQGRMPLIMGHEFVGTIAKMGSRVSPRWKLGDKVVSENTGGACGVCPACSRGDFVNCAHRLCIGCDVDGGFAEYVKIPGSILNIYPNCLYPIPENLSFEEATMLEPAANGYKAVIQEGRLHAGESVVVFGVGALGLMSIHMAAIAGATNIIAVGMSSDKATRFAIAKQLGATHCLVSDESENLVDDILHIVGEFGVELVIDAAGAPIVTKQAIQVTQNEGRIIRIGMSARNYDGRLDEFAFKSITIRGHMGYNQESWRNVLSLAKAGRLNLKAVITKVLPLEEFETGFELMRTQAASKVVLIP